MTLKNLRDAAHAVGLSPYELRRGALCGEYPFVPCGRKRLFDVDSLTEVLREKMRISQLEAQHAEAH